MHTSEKGGRGGNQTKGGMVSVRDEKEHGGGGKVGERKGVHGIKRRRFGFGLSQREKLKPSNPNLIGVQKKNRGTVGGYLLDRTAGKVVEEPKRKANPKTRVRIVRRGSRLIHRDPPRHKEKGLIGGEKFELYYNGSARSTRERAPRTKPGGNCRRESTDGEGKTN